MESIQVQNKFVGGNHTGIHVRQPRNVYIKSSKSRGERSTKRRKKSKLMDVLKSKEEFQQLNVQQVSGRQEQEVL